MVKYVRRGGRLLKIILFKLIFVLTIFLSACQSDTLIFSGEGEYWSAEVFIHQASGGESEEVMIRYKGDDLNSVGSFNYCLFSIILWFLYNKKSFVGFYVNI
jgi:hypothetical protein